MRNTQLSIGLGSEEADTLRLIAKREDRSIAAIVRRVVKEALTAEKPAEQDQ